MGCIVSVFMRIIQGRTLPGIAMIRRLSTDRPSTQILEVLKNVLHGEGITQPSYVHNPGPAKGENQMGKLYRMQVSGKKDGGDKTLNIICKVPPLCSIRREKFDTWKHYEREAFVYNKVLPAFDKVQTMMNVENKLNHPKCYHASADRHKEIIIMEDMEPKGFVVSGTRDTHLPVPELQSIIKELAHFHALSFAIKEHFSDSYKTLISDNHDILLTASMQGPLEGSAKKAMDLIDDQTVKKKFRKFSDDIYVKALEFLGPSLVEPYAVLTHGDFWGNNILLKRNNHGAADVCLIDYQSARYTSPLMDLMHLFVTAASSSTRIEHGKHLLDYYYRSLESRMKQLRCDPQKFYPRAVFQQHLTEYAGKFAAFIAMFFMPVTSMPREMLKDMDEYIRLLEANPHRTNEILIFKSEAGRRMYADKLNTVLRDLIQLELF